MRGTRLLIGIAAALFSGIAAVHAQYRDQDPSGRVARTSYLQGDVSFRPGTVDDWTTATLNYPLTSGDHLWTDANARAELHVGANAIRLGPQTAFEILELDDNHLQIRLTQGSALIHMRTLDVDDNVEIDTPTGAVTLLRDGTYRVDVSADGATSTVTARNGDAEVASNNETVDVHPNETALFTADGASEDVRYASPMDEYERWASARDRAEDASVSARYVSREMTGYEDLDRNGTWSDDPEYGHVWAPTYVAVDWAPYRYGRWVWVEPYGWTWIDDAPWGFAPFHYGRWAYARERWVWVPGVIYRRPVYAPALVVFVGGNDYDYRDSRWDDRRNVAWFPLAPNEVYRPVYRASDRYIRRVNVTNVNVTNINITNINVTNIRYRNQRVNGAVTGVSQDQFAGSRRIGHDNVKVFSLNDARYAHVVGAGAPVAPTQQSVLIRQDSRRVAVPPQAAQRRQVVWKNTPPARPATFASHADQYKTSGDAPVAPLPISQTRGAPRSMVTRPMSSTDDDADNGRRGDARRNDARSNDARRNDARRNDDGSRTPSGGVRVVPNPRPDVNVQRYTTEPVETEGNVDTVRRGVPNAQPRATERPEPRPNVNVRAAEEPQRTGNDRRAPSSRVNQGDSAMSHDDGPSPVNGSPNDGAAHTVDPNTTVRSVPRTQAAPAPRTERPRRERGEDSRPRKPSSPRTEAAPARRETDDRSTNDRRRTQDEDGAKPEPNDMPPRHE
ncbi:MAG: DUF6600 domain-containing protein [Gemmatimonadota bacterium]